MNPGRSGARWDRTQPRCVSPGALHLISLSELLHLQEALAHGRVPPDFQAKLARLAGDNLRHHFIEQHSRLFLALLLAEHTGDFPPVSPVERERLLRVLAYVRKDDDAIPDSEPGGFVDDLEEVRAASRALAPLLERFKHWRLARQVPALWLSQQSRHTHAPSRFGASLIDRAEAA
jgi:hypothetical protein